MKEGKIRFKTCFVSNKIPRDTKIGELKEWCEKFEKKSLTPEVKGNYTGNLSFRSRKGFIITASGLKSKENLSNNCFIYVEDYDKKTNTFYVQGKKKPSSESIMHHLIYETCEEINAVFHGHNNEVVTNAEKMKLTVTEKEYDSGTLELAQEVLNVLNNNKVIILKNHGFISLGKNMKEAGELALATLKQSIIPNLSTSNN